MTDDRAWAGHTDDGKPCVALGPPDESMRHAKIPPEAAREQARDLRVWIHNQIMGPGQVHEYLRFADELEQAANECEKPKRVG